jgi:hypothetical protein
MHKIENITMPPKMMHGHGPAVVVVQQPVHHPHPGHGPVVVVQQPVHHHPGHGPVVVVQQPVHHPHPRPVVVVQQPVVHHHPQPVYVQPQPVFVQQPMVDYPVLMHGGVVSLRSAATGQNLRAQNGLVDGFGQDGPFAKFSVHRDGPFVKFQSCASGTYIKCDQMGNLSSTGNGGPHCKFTISPVAPPTFCFTSIHGGNIGILENGQAKNAKQTANGKHGQFTVHRY